MSNRLTDMLALSHVPRWCIVPHIGEQTVSDHTFRALVIFIDLCDRLKIEYGTTDIMCVLYHDVSESRTADIPTPAKNKMAIGDQHKYCPWLPKMGFSSVDVEAVFELADMIEAFTYIERWGIGTHASETAMSIQRRINVACPSEWLSIVRRLMDDITFDKGRETK